MSFTIHGIQHLGVGVPNHEASWKWYRKFFGMDIPLFNDEAEAPLMTIYTKGKVISKRAAMILNIKGGCAMEVVSPSTFQATHSKEKLQLGDLGIFVGFIKTPNVQEAFNFFDSNKSWYPSTLWGINVKIPIYNSGEGAAKNKQKELEFIKAKNELVDIENQIISLFTLLKNNYKNALSSFKDQKTKVDLVENVYNNEEKKLSHGASNSLTISQRKMQLLQTKQALIQKEYELYKSEVQLRTHTNPIQL